VIQDNFQCRYTPIFFHFKVMIVVSKLQAIMAQFCSHRIQTSGKVDPALRTVRTILRLNPWDNDSAIAN